MKRLVGFVAFACAAVLAACGSSSNYNDAFAKLYSGYHDGYASLRTNDMVQVGADSGAPQVHLATSVTLPGATACFTDGEGSDAYAACLIADNVSTAEADSAFADQQKKASEAAQALNLKPAAAPPSAKATAWLGDGGSHVVLAEQPSGDGKATVSIVFASH